MFYTRTLWKKRATKDSYTIYSILVYISVFIPSLSLASGRERVLICYSACKAGLVIKDQKTANKNTAKRY